MLQTGGQQAIGLDFALGTGLIQISNLHAGGTGDLGVLAGQREATFFACREFLAGCHDLGVDQAVWLPFVIRRQVDNDQTQALADLRGGQSDSGRFVHGGEHARDQVADQIRVGWFHREGAGLQYLIRRDQDRQGADCR